MDVKLDFSQTKSVLFAGRSLFYRLNRLYDEYCGGKGGGTDCFPLFGKEESGKISNPPAPPFSKGGDKCLDQSNWYSRPDLSYVPTSTRLKPKEEKFLLEDVIYVEPGKEAEFEAVCKELMALWKSKNITEQGIQTFVCDVGPGMPIYVASAAEKDRIDFWDSSGKMWDKLGKEGEAIVAKGYALIRKREWRQGWFLPELSYITPKEKNRTYRSQEGY